MPVKINMLARLAVFLLLAPFGFSQATSDQFSIFFPADWHTPNNPDANHTMAQWMARYCEEWNCKAIASVGDYVLNAAQQAEWDTFTANAFNIVQSIGVPTIWATGNHDIGYSQGYATFDARFGGLPYMSCYPDCSHPHNAYLKLDIPVRRSSHSNSGSSPASLARAGVIRLGILSLDYLMDLSPGTGVRDWAQGVIDASEPNRQFVVVTHMLEGYGAYCTDKASCVGSNQDTGLGLARKFVLPNSKILWTVNGHAPYTPSSMTALGDDGRTVHSIGNDGASGGPGAAPLLSHLVFRPSDGKIDFYLRDYSGIPGARSFGKETWDWTPAPDPPAFLRHPSRRPVGRGGWGR